MGMLATTGHHSPLGREDPARPLMARVARSLLSMVGLRGRAGEAGRPDRGGQASQGFREERERILWLPYSFRVIDELPWGQYTKGRLAAGWAYPLGRNRIESALSASEHRFLVTAEDTMLTFTEY